MQATRDAASGDFTVTGTAEEIEKAAKALTEAFGDDDDVAKSMTEAAEESSGHTVEVTIPRDDCMEVADLWAFHDDDDLVKLGESMAEEIERANSEAIAKLEGGEG